MPEATVQGVASDTDALCLPDAVAWLSWWRLHQVLADNGRITDLEGQPYHPVWRHSDEACKSYCQLCGIRLEDAKGLE